MNKQVSIREQEIVVLFKIVVLAQTGNDWLKKNLADSLNLANSEITKVFDRLRFTGLIVGTRVQSLTFYEYLIYGLKATFPPSIGPKVRGLITGSGAIPESNIAGSDYVWKHAGEKRKVHPSPHYTPKLYLHLKMTAIYILR